jgi:site-specific DNA recombinase
MASNIHWHWTPNSLKHLDSPRHVEMTISLAFLAPVLVKAAVEGRLPRDIGVERLRDASAEWSQQLAKLGLAPDLA